MNEPKLMLGSRDVWRRSEINHIMDALESVRPEHQTAFDNLRLALGIPAKERGNNHEQIYRDGDSAGVGVR